MKSYLTFEQAFVTTIKNLIVQPDNICTSRNGNMYEKLGYSFKVKDASSYVFENSEFGRISYEYASDFYDWMTSKDEQSTEDFVSKYPHVSGFLTKPKSANLPENFNALYGPRILRQLPIILKELKNSENSRRCVISILSEGDLELLSAKDDPNLEFPCCDSATFNIRKNKLFMSLHMRSNNMGNVAKLDMYLWGRLMGEIAKELNVELGEVTYTIVSAHVFEKDFKYFGEVGIFSKIYDYDDKSLTLNLYRILAKTIFLDFRKSNGSLYTIRHAKTKNNVERLYQGGPSTKDEPIIEDSKNNDLIRKYVNVFDKIDHIFVSEYLRTTQTLQEIEKIVNAKVDKRNRLTDSIIVDSRLNEFNVGELDGQKMKSESSTMLTDLEYYLVDYTDTADCVFGHNGETLFQLYDRILLWLIDFVEEYDGANVLIVGHGIWIGSLQILLGLDCRNTITNYSEKPKALELLEI